ncbi:metallophosphoesterase family protein [Alicyclobacillus vulcanalis]|uniref:Predicted phosphodiesterase n=1 Tax=Alicyclobacillus vulcanalis TaxID=252246 RepID=A0A1N7NZL8_9BACL|nr:metallophosphoesterase family protein [Alicyclobacillus vulcanalis]SIT03659.1 Predicted phosphodiesterase [Alicyclobacillus vulcanalis]
MRIAFFSDVHGNELALDAVIADVRSVGCDRVYVLGDLAFRGYAPKACVEKVADVADGVIRGNADEWVLRGVRPGEAPEERRATMDEEAVFVRSLLTPDELRYLANLPLLLLEEAPFGRWLAFHATPYDPFPIVAPDASDADAERLLMAGHDARLYLYGHIHLPYVRTLGERIIANLGSVGMPFDGIPQASYLVVHVDQDQCRVEHRRVPYDVEAACRRYDDVGYPAAEMMKRVLRAARPV